MTTKTPTACPNCKRDLADNQRGKHCESKQCTWINCSCGHTVDVKRNNSIQGRHREAKS